MHDMLEEMGKRIELKDAVNRKRLWRAEDVKKMLRSKKWADSVEAIVLHVSEFDNRWLSSNVFQNMHSLRLIYLYGDYTEKRHEIQVDIVYLPDDMKYLHWENYPSKSLPSSFNPTNLIVLRLSGSHMEQLWNEDHEDLVNLREINVFHCNKLRKIPNLSRAINLKLLRCCFCESLVELAGLDHLASLEEVDFAGCKSLRKIPNLSEALNLKLLNCSICKSLVELPCLDHLASLEEVNLYRCTNLRKISNLSRTLNLKKIDCFGCSSLIELPCLDHLASLEEINLGDCKSLRKIPNLSGALNIKIINCSWCSSLVELPSLNHLASLKELLLDLCYNLKKFPEVPNHFCKLDLSGFPIEEVPDSVEHLVRLKSLNISNSLVKKVSTNISKLESLHDLDLSCCPITEFPEAPRNLTESHLRFKGLQVLRTLKKDCQVDFEMPWHWQFKTEGDHVLILFSHDMIQIDKDYEEASFQFYIKYPNFIEEESVYKYRKVEKCGIHVFYVDAETEKKKLMSI